jgi:hypothetical protein
MEEDPKVSSPTKLPGNIGLYNYKDLSLAKCCQKKKKKNQNNNTKCPISWHYATSGANIRLGWKLCLPSVTMCPECCPQSSNTMAGMNGCNNHNLTFM